MIKKPILLAIVLSFSLLFASSSFAFTRLSSIVKKLQQKGFSHIREIELKHGMYKIEGYNNHCTKFKLRIDARTGHILNRWMKKNHHISMYEVIRKVEARGYRRIQEVEFDDGSYEVKATSRYGDYVKLYVNPYNGKIS